MNPLLNEIENDITGLAALRDWLGDSGDPVHPLVAEMRAERCVHGNNGQPCPLNKAPRWWELAKEKAAQWIRKEIELKSHMNLRVSQEDGLGMCAACGCCIPLKVWAPGSVVKSHLTQNQLDKTPDFCWMRKEISAQ